MTGRFASQLCVSLLGISFVFGSFATAQGKAIKNPGVQVVADNDLLPNPLQEYGGLPGQVEWDFPGKAIKEKGLVFTAQDGNSPFPAGGGALALNSSFLFDYEFNFEVNGVPDLVVTGVGSGHVAGGSTALEPDVFLLSMDQFDLSGTIPTGSPTPFMLRESPSESSTGVTTLTSLGGGQYQIDSFFDIFTEISLDGGQTWVPATAQVPEPSTLVLMSLSGLAALSYRRRR